MMPRGEPQSVPDPAGEAFDEWVRRKRAEERAREAAEYALANTPSQRWAGSPARTEAHDARSATPMNPEALRAAPAIEPAIEAVDDVKGDRPWQALGNGGLAIADAALMATGFGVAGAVSRGAAWNTGKMTGRNAAKQLRDRGVAGSAHEVHHSVPLRGMSRDIPNWRNHVALLKVLEIAKHKRLRGKWDGAPKYGPVEALLVGTPDWMKTVPAWFGAKGVEALAKHQSEAGAQKAQKPRLPAPYGERPLR